MSWIMGRWIVVYSPLTLSRYTSYTHKNGFLLTYFVIKYDPLADKIV